MIIGTRTKKANKRERKMHGPLIEFDLVSILVIASQSQSQKLLGYLSKTRRGTPRLVDTKIQCQESLCRTKDLVQKILEVCVYLAQDQKVKFVFNMT